MGTWMKVHFRRYKVIGDDTIYSVYSHDINAQILNVLPEPIDNWYWLDVVIHTQEFRTDQELIKSPWD